MRKYIQTKLYDPVNKVAGNCFATCVATLSGIDPSHFPDLEEEDDWDDYKGYINEVLNHYGYTLLCLSPDDWVLRNLKAHFPNVPMIVGGDSPRGVRHAVIYLNGEMIHDPHPDGGGIDRPNYNIYILVQVKPWNSIK